MQCGDQKREKRNVRATDNAGLQRCASRKQNIELMLIGDQEKGKRNGGATNNAGLKQRGGKKITETGDSNVMG